MRALPKLALLLLLCCAAARPALSQTSLASFSPTGSVKGVRQVQARFSGQMVPFGDLRLEDPFTIDCPEQGKGRWIDGSSWSYDFVRDLPAGVACRFTLKPELKDIAGKPLGGERAYTFDTGGPAVVEMAPREGSGNIDEQQIFLLGLDAEARDDTIAAHAWCRADGVNEKIPLRVLAGAEREQILEQRKNFVDRYLAVYFRARGVTWRATAGARSRKLERMPVAVLQCQRRLPADAKVALVWGAGIAAGSGIVTTEAQTLTFKTRPDFTARFSCERLSVKGACIPFMPMRLDFSAPIRMADALAIRLAAGASSYAASVDKDESKAEYVSAVTINGPFPERAKLMLSLPPDLKDDAGRALVNRARFPLTVLTDTQPPLVKFPARFGIIEAQGDKLLPVTVRNVEAALAARVAKVDPAAAIGGAMLRVEGRPGHADPQGEQDQQVIAWLQRMSRGGGWSPGELYVDDMRKPLLDGAQAERFSMPKPGGAQAFEVVGIPLRKPGFYVVELASPKLGAALNGKPQTAYVSTAALVTNLVAHFKHGNQSSLVWVTSLDKGKPVARAQVAVRDCAGKLLWQGVSNAMGVASIEQELPESRCKRSYGYFVSARSGADMTFTLSSWDSGIESWRFNLPAENPRTDNTIAATVFDRSLLRAGETVHMKHFLRRHVNAGIGYSAKLPDKLFLLHEGSEQKYELALQWSGGAAENTWNIPADARQGWYAVMLDGRESGRFRVEQFRVPTMKMLLQGPKAPAIQAGSVDLDVQLSYLSGGGAGGAPVKLRTVVENKTISFDDYADFSFSNGDVKVGMEKGAMYDEDEDMFDEGEGAADAPDGAAQVPGAGRAGVRTRSLVLDQAGGARITLDQLPVVQSPRELLAEMSYQDANGETASVSTRIPLWPSNYVIGIQPDGWVMSKEALKFSVVVLDTQGKPVADAPVAVDFFQRLNYSHRRRLVGGFYAYENGSEIKALGSACEGKTDSRGLLICETKAPASGNLILRAKTLDEHQRAAVANRETWVADGADWWFKASDNDRIDLLPEKKRYEPGENASFQVRMPFRDATALVTVEREGVIDTYVRQLSGKSPVFSIPVKKNYAPNVYVSALVVRGRVASVPPTALVDLGKPAYKLGIAPLRVGWAGNELKVQVSADKPVYRIREKANVAVKVTRADGSPVPAGAEVALAAVDVGLLELMPNTSWDLLEAMMQQRSLQVQTATAQMQVVGKRHFGRKAVPHGGGGGKGASRELFDTLLFWKARVTLDANGEAQVQVPINDSLTAFRIVAVASADADLFGTGRTEVRSSQDLILLSGLPALVREGDRFRAGFTLRNTTDADVNVEIGATAAGRVLARQTLSLAAGQAREVGWDYVVPFGVPELQWDVSAKVVAGDGPASMDKLRVKQKVTAAVPVRTLQATLLQLDRPQSMKVQLPEGALAGRGGVQALFSAKLGSELPGVREYMTAYPYSCFEQSTSRAIALRDPALWKALADKLPAYLDSDGLLKYFASMDQGSDSLTAYVLSATQEAGYPIPPELQGRMEEGLRGFVRGTVVRYSSLATADLAVRKIAALEALSRGAAVAAGDLESFTIEPNLWPTSAVIDWYLILHRSPKLPRRDAQLAQVQQILRARLNLQGSTLGFSTERKDDWWWLMASADVNANRLILAMLDNPDWQADMGRMARGALGRQRAGHWGTTVANAWGVLAIDKFSQKFESVPVTGISSASLGTASKSIAFAGDVSTGSVLLPWPRGESELQIEHAGKGKPWVTVQSMAALPLKAALGSGYRISKRITAVEQKTAGVWSRGDVYRVHLDLEAQSDMTWVVVDDPIPASATLLGSGLGRDSKILSGGEKSTGWVWPAFEERSFEAYRAYYQFVPKGKWSVEYTVRLNNPGQFTLPPTRVEAMYSPEMFGAAPNQPFSVK